MKPISPEEVSALFDGELTPDRAEEVRRAIVENEELHRLYQQMASADSALRSFAAACRFEPRLSLPNSAPVPDFPIYAVAFGLLILRIVGKILPFGPGIGLQALAIAILVAWLLYRFLPTLKADIWQLAREVGLGSE